MNRRKHIKFGLMTLGGLLIPQLVPQSKGTAYIVTTVFEDEKVSDSQFSDLFDRKIAPTIQESYNQRLNHLTSKKDVSFRGLKKIPGGWESIIETPLDRVQDVYSSLEFIRGHLKQANIRHSVRITSWADTSLYTKKR